MKPLQFILTQNSLENVFLGLLFAIALFAILFIVRRLVTNRLRTLSDRTDAIWDDIVVDTVSATKLPFVVAISILAGLTQIDLPPLIGSFPYKAMMVLLILQVGVWSVHALRTWLRRKVDLSADAGDGAAITNLGVISFIAQLLIWGMVVLLLLDNLGVSITALVASLGIGGIAIALALQNILGDLFASLSIALDKPFVIGDFIVVGDMMGTVKRIGLKTTRVQSLSGEMLVFSNADLLKSRIKNYQQMTERRVVLEFAVTYDTSIESLIALAAALREMIERCQATRFERAHCKRLGLSGLEFEAVYFVLSGDYTQHMDIQQQINFELLRYCRAGGISMAFPTRTLHIANLPH